MSDSENSIPAAKIVGDAPALDVKRDGELPPGVTIVPTYKLFTPNHVAAATFFGGPLGGSAVLALNERRLGNGARAWMMLAFGVAITVVLFGLTMDLGAGVRLGLAVICLFVMQGIGRALHDKALNAHLAAGGKLGSGWAAFGLGIAGLATAFGGFMVYAIATGIGGLGVPKVTVSPGHEIYYRDGATEAQARRLGALLDEPRGFFSHSSEAAIGLRQHDAVHIVEFVVQDRVFVDTDMQKQFRQIGDLLSHDVFDGEPVEVWLDDNRLAPKLKLAPTPR